MSQIAVRNSLFNELIILSFSQYLSHVSTQSQATVHFTNISPISSYLWLFGTWCNTSTKPTYGGYFVVYPVTVVVMQEDNGINEINTIA